MGDHVDSDSGDGPAPPVQGVGGAGEDFTETAARGFVGRRYRSTARYSGVEPRSVGTVSDIYSRGISMNSTTEIPGGPVRSKHLLAGVAPELALPVGVFSLGVCFFGVVKLTATLIGAGVGWQIALVGSAAVGYLVLFVVVEALFGWLFGPLSSMWVWLAPPVASSRVRRCPRWGRVEPTRCRRCGQADEGPELDVDDTTGCRLVRDAFRRAGIVLPASVSEQYLQTSDAVVPVDRVAPGDLLFLGNGRPGAVDQVVICAGHNRGRIKFIDVQGLPPRRLGADVSFTATRPLESQGAERLRRPALPRPWRGSC